MRNNNNNKPKTEIIVGNTNIRLIKSDKVEISFCANVFSISRELYSTTIKAIIIIVIVFYTYNIRSIITMRR